MKLSVIIVTFNHQKYLENCLASLLKSLEAINSEVIVVDNHSTNGTIERLKEIGKSKFKVIQNKKNLGFAQACNQGIKKAKGGYLLLLNPDTQVNQEGLRKLIEFLDKNKEAACGAPQLLNPDKSLQYSIRRFPDSFTVIARRTPLRRLSFVNKRNNFHLMKNISHHQTREIDWALGSCLLVRKETFKKIGLFDEGFFVYCEDIDWFWRLKKAGLKAYYFPQTKIIHHHLARSDKKLFSKESYYHLRSIVYFFRKYWQEILTGRYPEK